MCEPDTVNAHRFHPRGAFRATWAWLARHQTSSRSPLPTQPRGDDPRARTSARHQHVQIGRTTELSHALTSGQLQQVNSTTCGAASLIAARMLLQPHYANHLLTPDPHDDVRSRFTAQSAAVHHRTTRMFGRVGPRRRAFRIRPPWPRALGTPPWGVRDELTALAAVPYRTVLIDPGSAQSRARAFALLTDTVTAGLPAALFTGNGVLPRHVVLAVDTGLRVYDPGRGVVVPLNQSDFVDGELGAVAWTQPWAVVVPRAVGMRR